MKNIGIAATALALAFTASVPAMAATTKTYKSVVSISDETLGGGNHVDVTGASKNNPVNFDIMFSFVTPVISSIDAIISNALKNSPVTFTSLKIFAFGSNTILGKSTTNEVGNPGVTIEASADAVPAGKYVAEVMGTTNKNVTISANIALSAVPLPSTVALFGTAVLGLGLVGAARRRRSAGATTAA